MGFVLRSRLILLILAVVAIQNISTSTLTKLLNDKLEMKKASEAIRTNPDRVQGLTTFINAVKTVRSSAEKFFNSPTMHGSSNIRNLKWEISRDFKEYDKAWSFITNYKDYKVQFSNFDRFLNLMYEIKEYNYWRSRNYISPSYVCNRLQFSTRAWVRSITIKSICKDTLSCPSGTHLYKKAFFPSYSKPLYRQNVRSACTSTSHCNLNKALPLMAGLFYYQTNEMIFQRICTTKCRGSCDYTKTFQTLMEDADMLIKYAETMPSYWSSKWKSVINEGLAGKALSDINVVNDIIERNRKGIEHAKDQCSVIKAPNACKLASLLEHNALFKTTIERKNIKIKDLRDHSHIDFSKVVQLQNDNVHHIQLLGGIKRLDDNLRASVKGISKYFDGLATYDKGIAKDNGEYIKDELPIYKQTLIIVENRLKNDIKEAMNYMMGILAGNLAAEIGKLAALVITNANPLKAMFSGPDVLDLTEQAEKVADATSQVVKGSFLIKSLNELKDDSLKVMKDFEANERQMESLGKIAEKLSLGNNDIEKDVEMFIKEYRKEAPVNRKHLLVKNNALWSAFKGAVCDVLNGDVSIAGAVLKSIAGSKLICERLEGTLAQFFSLKEELYDFTFQLSDSIVAIARGNLAKRFAANIKGTHDSVDGIDYFIGSYIFQSKVQKLCSVYCDILEYKHFGKPVKPCRTQNGVFVKKNLDDLIAYKDNTPHSEVHKNVYLPTRSTTKGETGVIDLQALARGEKVLFKIPADRNWLQKYGWISPEDTVLPFLKSLKIFLPQKNYGKWTQSYTSTYVTMTSVSESSVSLDTNAAVYLLPKATVSFRTIYEEGYPTCPNEIKNPYLLCKNDPKMCDKTRRVTTDQTLMPTVVSTWSLKATFYEGATKIKYDAPSPETNLLLRGEALLKMPFQNRKKRNIYPRSDEVVSKDGCCPGNKYRLSVYNRSCGECPKGTSSLLGGLFCQIDKAS